MDRFQKRFEHGGENCDDYYLQIDNKGFEKALSEIKIYHLFGKLTFSQITS